MTRAWTVVRGERVAHYRMSKRFFTPPLAELCTTSIAKETDMWSITRVELMEKKTHVCCLAEMSKIWNELKWLFRDRSKKTEDCLYLCSTWSLEEGMMIIIWNNSQTLKGHWSGNRVGWVGWLVDEYCRKLSFNCLWLFQWNKCFAHVCAVKIKKQK